MRELREATPRSARLSGVHFGDTHEVADQIIDSQLLRPSHLNRLFAEPRPTAESSPPDLPCPRASPRASSGRRIIAGTRCPGRSGDRLPRPDGALVPSGGRTARRWRISPLRREAWLGDTPLLARGRPLGRPISRAMRVHLSLAVDGAVHWPTIRETRSIGAPHPIRRADVDVLNVVVVVEAFEEGFDLSALLRGVVDGDRVSSPSDQVRGGDVPLAVGEGLAHRVGSVVSVKSAIAPSRRARGPAPASDGSLVGVGASPAGVDLDSSDTRKSQDTEPAAPG